MSKHNTDTSDQHAAKRRWLNAHEEGYHKAMGNRQVQMIAIGGAIGTGLFLGAGARLQMAGPALALVYLICGLFSFFILRALGELVLHRPSSGSFVSYAREFLGENWRRADLIRTGKFVEYIKERNKWAKRSGTIQDYNVRYPIPNEEIEQNPDMTQDDQNPGYR